VETIATDVGLIDAELPEDEPFQATPVVKPIGPPLSGDQPRLQELVGRFVLDQFLGAIGPGGDLFGRVGVRSMLDEEPEHPTMEGPHLLDPGDETIDMSEDGRRELPRLRPLITCDVDHRGGSLHRHPAGPREPIVEGGRLHLPPADSGSFDRPSFIFRTAVDREWELDLYVAEGAGDLLQPGDHLLLLGEFPLQLLDPPLQALAG